MDSVLKKNAFIVLDIPDKKGLKRKIYCLKRFYMFTIVKYWKLQFGNKKKYF